MIGKKDSKILSYLWNSIVYHICRLTLLLIILAAAGICIRAFAYGHVTGVIGIVIVLSILYFSVIPPLREKMSNCKVKLNKISYNRGNNRDNYMQYYMSLPYSVEIKRNNIKNGKHFVATYKEIKNSAVVGYGNDEIEAITELKNAFRFYLDNAFKNGFDIPKPD